MELLTLNDGNKIQAITFGTYDLIGGKAALAIESAINTGYRHIDTSTNYNNEGAVGEAVRRSDVPRSDLFITSKLPGAYHDFDGALNIIQEQLYRTGLDYFDGYLIHWPNPKQKKYVEAWKALVEAQKRGLIRSIGVSNFLPEHLDKIINETGVTPAINQSEIHPFFSNKDVIAADQKLGIVTEAWSPFGRDRLDLLSNDTLATIAEKHHKSISQVIIRWDIQNHVVPVVKSGNPVHQAENLDVFDFELTPKDMAAIDALNKGEAGRIEGQHPNHYEEFE